MNTKKTIGEADLQALAAQLACPHGGQADTVADMMAESNRSMIDHALDHLQLQAGQRVLELGHGGADHLDGLLARQPNLHYSGLEISAAMHQRAEARHAHDNAVFYLYDGIHLPIFDTPFARLFSVNTLHFWRQPAVFMQSLCGCLDNDGIMALTYGSKAFMQTLPFTAYGFTLYDPQDIEQLISPTALTLIGHYAASEQVISKVGAPVLRHYYTTVLQKKERP